MRPFKCRNGSLEYCGNQLFSCLAELPTAPYLDESRQLAASHGNTQQSVALIELYDELHRLVAVFMRNENALLFNLPILTRMISSPGALSGTIPTDVAPFAIPFFGREMFLTQSSQLFLELSLTLPGISALYCWDKSFRNEPVDFRHLPEFSHVEFEARHSFPESLEVQERFFRQITQGLLENQYDSLRLFIGDEGCDDLQRLASEPFETVTFKEAIKMLSDDAGDELPVTIASFDALAEIRLSEILGDRCVFVTEYLSEEVAFYHAENDRDPGTVVNADLLVPGYGELIGSGQRISDRDEIGRKAEFFKLDFEDYDSYLASREYSDATHSGWGMGIERYLQFVLKLPAIWLTQLFPRTPYQLPKE